MSTIEEVSEPLPAEVKRRLNCLKNLQDNHSELEAKFREEVLELEKKYLGLYKPLYSKRSEIVAGKVEPTDAECNREKDDEDEDDDEAPANPSATPVSGIPNFWLTALKNNRVLSSTIFARDEDALKSLTDIRVAYLDDNPGFKLEFSFADNDYFTNKVLEKTYFLHNSVDAGYGDVVYDRAEGTKIEWKEGKDLSVTIEIKKQRHKASNKTRTVKKTVPAETFFSFFTPPKPPTEEDEEVEEEVEDKLEADYECGEIIKEKIIPHAVDWFTGKALLYEDSDYDEEGGFFGDGGDDDEDDDDDEDGAGDNQEKPPECKQQ
ncbi:hypothetical protein HK101_007573 [Irineochytrium annulatum]|nr:hypothetical protein HK101_007573 [Irineochytrium annulatum]